MTAHDGAGRARQALARWGEDLAARHLQQQGYTVLGRNVRTPYGELDIVAQAPTRAALVFVEVKTRSSRRFGLPEDSVTLKKQAHLLDSARHYLQTHPELDGDWQVDVIAIERYPSQEPIITHFENVLS